MIIKHKTHHKTFIIMGSGASSTCMDDCLSPGDSKDSSVNENKVRSSYLAGHIEVQIASSVIEPIDFTEWKMCFVEVSKGKIVIRNDKSQELIIEIDLHGRPEISLSKADKKTSLITVKAHNAALKIRSSQKDESKHWLRVLREEIMFCNSANDTDGSGMKSILDQFRDVFAVEDENADIPEQSDKSCLFVKAPSSIVPPPMNVVILVVGTRGDVQPFIYLGQALQKYGHRVRLATHTEYRDDVVVKGGLEYYPLAGDPRKLSEYMVKTGGRLMPDLLNEEERRNLPEKMHMLKDITFSCFPACTAPDPEDPQKRGFLADAIISNPVSYGHIHCAEALCVPLHIMFPQPWSPTKEFPHPLSNLGFESQWSAQNYYSYVCMDEFMWLGLGSIINNFRKQVLKIPPIRVGESGAHLLNDNKVPISHMWSPALVPKCKDWGRQVDVVGEFRSMSGAPIAFTPPQALVDFLAAGDKPIYIGFGSMVIEDAARLTDMAKAASEQVGCRVLMQSGWTKYAEDNTLLTDRVMVIGAMPHDWLLHEVCGVIHHGGAGTTSAGLRAGNPTFICPFFGDQHFWAEMVNRAGCGPKGCPIAKLTTEKLVHAFETLRNRETIDNTAKLAAQMNQENGVQRGLESFHNSLPITDMICEVGIFNNKQSDLATIYCDTCGLKMCAEVDRVVHRHSAGSHVRAPFRAARWGIVGPTSVLDGVAQGVGVAAYELAGGVYDLFAKPIAGARQGGVKGALQGTTEGLVNFIARPILGGAVLLDRVVTGACHLAAPTSNDSNLADEAQAKLTSNHNESFLLSSTTKSSSSTSSGGELSESDKRIEEAFFKALKVLDLWRKIDKSKDRMISEVELSAIVPNAKAFLEAADFNNDGVLTFAEFAWQLSQHFQAQDQQKEAVDRSPDAVYNE